MKTITATLIRQLAPLLARPTRTDDAHVASSPAFDDLNIIPMQGSMPASFQRSRAIFASDDSPWRPRSFYAHRRQIQRALPVAAAAFCTLLLLLLFRLGLFSSDQPPPLIVDPTPPHDDGSSRPPFYLWETASSFKPVTLDPKGKSVKDLCATFPHHILDTIQPVLKLGHADLGKPALDAQMKTVSACLDNVLVFSDLDDELPSGHFAHDVLSDLPASYRDHVDFGNYTYMRQLRESGALDVDKEATAKIRGWNLDKYKFLPMIERAWSARPNHPWYVFYETDTYIFWDNMFRLLDNFDPDAPLYMGSPSPGREVADTKHQVWFANGGPGFVLSREAVRRLLKRQVGADGDYLDAPASHRWRDLLEHDCCGDSVLGWALYKAGVTLSGLWPLFNPHSLHAVPFSDKYWCQPVVALHKTRPADMEELWRWEHANRKHEKPILYRDLFEFHHPGQPSTRADWDNMWEPITIEGPPKTATFEECGAACQEHSACFQYNWHGDKCYLVQSIRLGHARDAEKETEEHKGGSFQSGWLSERIAEWRQQQRCEVVQWVRPSLTRIY
ncbi:hypothetical protein ACHAPW_004836 [Verticillium nonalfalfae]